MQELKVREYVNSDILRALNGNDELFTARFTAEELETSKKFDDAVDENITDNEKRVLISDLAMEWNAATSNASFKEGFKLATKIFVAGMS
jgi:hypothetical protein